MRKEETVYDYLVIGGGIAGLSSAYHLAKDGHTVAVLEKNDGKQSASFNSTAMMCHDPDVDWAHALSRFGANGAKEFWDLGELGMQLITAYAQDNAPAFISKRVPSHIFANSAEKAVELREQYELYKKIGIPATFAENGSSLLSTFRSVLTVENDGVTNNQAILRTLTRKVRGLGGKVLHNRPVDSISFTSGIAEVTSAGKVFRGKEAILTTGDQQLFPDLPKTDTQRTFVVGYENHKLPELFRSSILWDNEEPYHYIRSFKGYTIWVGGEDVEEKDYDPKKDYSAAIETFAREHLLFDSSYKRVSDWSGTFYPAENGIPHIGKVADKPLYMAVGFGGTGVVMSFVSGYLLASWMKGQEKKYEPLFAVPQE